MQAFIGSVFLCNLFWSQFCEGAVSNTMLPTVLILFVICVLEFK